MFDLSSSSYGDYGFPSLEPRLTEYGTGLKTAAPTGSTGPTTGGFGLNNILQAATAIVVTGIQAKQSGSGSLEDAVVEALNQVERGLIQNRNNYLAGNGGLAAQTAALAEFDRAWAWVIGPNGLGTSGLGAWGSVGITDRQRSGKFDWFAAYHDPIAQDTRITSNPVTGTISKLQQTLGVSSTVLGIIAIGIAVLMARKYSK